MTPLSERKEDRDVTVTKEAGLDYQMSVWVGIFAPKSTPKPIVDKLAVALDKSLDDPGVKAKVAELGGSIPPKSERTPAKFSRFVNAEIARWSPVLNAAFSRNSDLTHARIIPRQLRPDLRLDDRFHETDHIGCHHSLLVNRHFAGTS